jgi:hypothetical protein
MIKARRALALGMLAFVALGGCSKKEKEVALTAEQAEVKTRLETQVREAADTRQTYHAMDNATLLARLMEQSKSKREPFNSPAYRELKTRTDLDAKALAALISENRNADGLLPLLLLRTRDRKSYLELSAELRARILSDALQSSQYFNAWGLPGLYLQDASRAMIETGSSANAPLKRLLADTRPAPVFGSQEYTMYKKYKFRVCDYALYFLEAIKGNPGMRLPVAPEERDALIKEAAKP